MAVAHLIETSQGRNQAAEMATHPYANDAVKLGFIARAAPKPIARMAQDRIWAESGVGRYMDRIADVAAGGDRRRSLGQRLREAFR